MTKLSFAICVSIITLLTIIIIPWAAFKSKNYSIWLWGTIIVWLIVISVAANYNF